MYGPLKDLLRTQPHRQVLLGESGTEVYFLPGIRAYLKTRLIGNEAKLSRERDVLRWLKDKISVPRVLGFEMSGKHEYILLSEIRGMAYSDRATDLFNAGEAQTLAENVAVRVREIHDLSIRNCYLDQRLNIKLGRALENVKGSLIDESDFDDENLGKTAEEVYDELTSSPAPSEDLVFTHGDLCLPNIIIRKSEVGGFIDFDRGGIADRYQDIALFLRSFRRNSPPGIDVETAFCRGYAIESLDRDKLDFYRKLDELL